jgi:hypothetical protein
MLSVIYDTLKNGWVFEDFLNLKSNKINVLLDKHHRSTMTDTITDLPGVIAKSDEADFLRDLIQDAVQRLMIC